MTSDAVHVPASAPGGPAVLRPSRAAYGRALRANLWIAIPLLLISLFRIATNWWLLPVFAISLGLAFAGVLLYFRNARVEFGDGSYTAASMLGRRRTFFASDATTVVTVTALAGSGMRATSLLIVLGRDGAKLLKLRSQTWEIDQFVQLATDLNSHGVPTESIRDPITAAQLKERFPNVVSWAEAHPIAAGLLIGLGIIVVVTLIVIGSVFLVPA